MYQNGIGAAGVLPNNTASIAPRTLTSAVAVYGSFLVFKRCKINRIGVVVTTAIVAGLTAPAITFRKRPTPGSATGQSLVGVITIPTGTAVGQVVYKDVSPVELDEGMELCIDHTVQATDSGSAAGAGLAMFEAQEDPESVKSVSNMILSA